MFMKVLLSLNYRTKWGQSIYIYGSTPELGNYDENRAIEMCCVSESIWNIQLEIEKDSTIKYNYIIKERDQIIRREWDKAHSLILEQGKTFFVKDEWYEIPNQKFLYTSGFSESFFYHETSPKINYDKSSIIIKVLCPYVNKDESPILSGSSVELGKWQADNALRLNAGSYGEWYLIIDSALIQYAQEYKLAIYDQKKNAIVHWEEGCNRILNPIHTDRTTIQIESIVYRYGWINWKAAGVSIPVFSLRSNDSYGIGEFSDLKKLIDWAAITGQKIIQVLPINDTTISYTWTDSYPYNAISIYALHPIYLGLKEYPLKNIQLYEEYEQESYQLNSLKEIDYEAALSLKWKYIRALYEEIGEETLLCEDFRHFYIQNEYWLFPYACFSFLRDKYKTANHTSWNLYSKYNKVELEKLIETDNDANYNKNLLCFTQYLLHRQLIEAKEYAHNHNVILKGDIPIGISHDSVEAWVEPHLFNLDTQTGAPPDDFSINGQNWGFPTYNWNEMAKNGYEWWIRRFRKMADYFDAYRIDHILGFFRIWEIPQSSIQGLLGYFSPALPLSIEEMESKGLGFDEYRMTNPYIHRNFLKDLFEENVAEVIAEYMHPIGIDDRFELNEEYNTQIKIKNQFTNKTDSKSNHIRDGLYHLCSEVLFIRDKHDPNKYHPRITAQHTYSYRNLDNDSKNAFNYLYDNFFYYRHSQFWYNEAMKKLPTLISSTSMLVCGEDLGMIPSCVPTVMNALQILSLEIERMPKEKFQLFANLKELPYMSVCSTSTHDMSPIRTWWLESKEITQQYYNNILEQQGVAPDECTPEICNLIIKNHLNAPSMLTVIPLQDWLSIDGNIRRENAQEERINIPSIPRHYWRYRMHLTLEELINSNNLNDNIRSLIETSIRN